MKKRMQANPAFFEVLKKKKEKEKRACALGKVRDDYEA